MPLNPYWFRQTRSGSAQQLGWNAGSTLNLTVIPAGHQPGTYIIYATADVQTAAGAGTITRAATYGYSNANRAVNGFGGSSVTATGLPAGVGWTPMVVQSDGTRAIVAIFTPASITGSPVIDVYASARLVQAL